jgi:hypothetical protein
MLQQGRLQAPIPDGIGALNPGFGAGLGRIYFLPDGNNDSENLQALIDNQALGDRRIITGVPGSTFHWLKRWEPTTNTVVELSNCHNVCNITGSGHFGCMCGNKEPSPIADLGLASLATTGSHTVQVGQIAGSGWSVQVGSYIQLSVSNSANFQTYQVIAAPTGGGPFTLQLNRALLQDYDGACILVRDIISTPKIIVQNATIDGHVDDRYFEWVGAIGAQVIGPVYFLGALGNAAVALHSFDNGCAFGHSTQLITQYSAGQGGAGGIVMESGDSNSYSDCHLDNLSSYGFGSQNQLLGSIDHCELGAATPNSLFCVSQHTGDGGSKALTVTQCQIKSLCHLYEIDGVHFDTVQFSQNCGVDEYPPLGGALGAKSVTYTHCDFAPAGISNRAAIRKMSSDWTVVSDSEFHAGSAYYQINMADPAAVNPQISVQNCIVAADWVFNAKASARIALGNNILSYYQNSSVFCNGLSGAAVTINGLQASTTHSGNIGFQGAGMTVARSGVVNWGTVATPYGAGVIVT